MSGRRWAKADEQALRKLYPAFLRKEIAWEQMEKALDRSYHAINKKAGELRLTGKVEPTLDVEYFRKLVKDIEL